MWSGSVRGDSAELPWLPCSCSAALHRQIFWGGSARPSPFMGSVLDIRLTFFCITKRSLGDLRAHWLDYFTGVWTGAQCKVVHHGDWCSLYSYARQCHCTAVRPVVTMEFIDLRIGGPPFTVKVTFSNVLALSSSASTRLWVCPSVVLIE